MSVGSGYEYYYVEEAPPPPFADDEGRETAAPSPVGSSSPSRSRSPRSGSAANPSSQNTKGADSKKGLAVKQEGRVFVAAASTNNARSGSPHAAAAAVVVPVGGGGGRSVSPAQIQHTEYLGGIGGRHNDGGYRTNTCTASTPLSEASGVALGPHTAMHRSHSQVSSSVGVGSSAASAGTLMRRSTAPPQLPEVLLSSKSARRAERRRVRELERRFGRGDHSDAEGVEGEEGANYNHDDKDKDDEETDYSSSLEEEPQPPTGRHIGAGGAPVPLPTPKPSTNVPRSVEGEEEGKGGNTAPTRSSRRRTPRRADDAKVSASTPRTTTSGALVVAPSASSGGGSPPSSVAVATSSSTPRTALKASVSPAVRIANQAAVAAAAPSLIHVERSDALKGLAAQHEHVVEARLEHAAEEKRSETHKILASKYRELMAARAQLAAKEEKSSLRRRSMPVGLAAAAVATPRTPPAASAGGAVAGRGNSNNNSPTESHSPISNSNSPISIPTADHANGASVGIIGKYTSPQQRFLAAEREALGANTTMIPVGGSVPPTAAAAAAAFDIEDDDDDLEGAGGGGMGMGGGYREDDEGEMNYDGDEHRHHTTTAQRHYRHHHRHHHDPSSDAAALYVRQVVERANERLRLRRLSAAYMAEHERKVKEEMRRRKKREQEEEEGEEGRQHSEEEGATSRSTSTSPSRKSRKAKKKASKRDKEEKKKKTKKKTRPVGHDGHASFPDQEGSSYGTNNESEEYNDNASTTYDYRDDDDFGRVMSPPPRGGAGLMRRGGGGGGSSFGGHDSDGTVAGSGGEGGYGYGTYGAAEGGPLHFGEEGTYYEEEEQHQRPENEVHVGTFTRTATDPEKEKDFYGDYYARKRMLEAMRRERMEKLKREQQQKQKQQVSTTGGGDEDTNNNTNYGTTEENEFDVNDDNYGEYVCDDEDGEGRVNNNENDEETPLPLPITRSPSEQQQQGQSKQTEATHPDPRDREQRQQEKKHHKSERRHRFDGLKAVYDYKFEGDEEEEEEVDATADYDSCRDHHDSEGGRVLLGAGRGVCESALLIRSLLLQGGLGNSEMRKDNSSPLQEEGGRAAGGVSSVFPPLSTSVVAVPPQQLIMAFTYPATAEEVEQPKGSNQHAEKIEKKEEGKAASAAAGSALTATLSRLAAVLALSSPFPNQPKSGGEEDKKAIISRRLHELQKQQMQLFQKRRGSVDKQATKQYTSQEEHTTSTSSDNTKNGPPKDHQGNHRFYKRIIYHHKEDESQITSRTAAGGGAGSDAVSTFAAADGTVMSVTVDADGLVTVNRSISEGEESAVENKTNTIDTIGAGPNQTTNTAKAQGANASSSSTPSYCPPLAPSAILLSSTTTASTSTDHLFGEGVNNKKVPNQPALAEPAPISYSSASYLFKTPQTCLLSAQRCKYKAFSQMTKREQQRCVSTATKMREKMKSNVEKKKSNVSDDDYDDDGSCNKSSESFREVLHDMLSPPTAQTNNNKNTTTTTSAAPLLPPETHSHWVIDKEILAVESKTVVKVVTTDPNNCGDGKRHPQKGGGEQKEASASFDNPIDRTAATADNVNKAEARSTTSCFGDMNDISSVHRVASEEDTSLPPTMGGGVGEPPFHRPSVADVDADDDDATPRARHPSPSPPLLNLASLQQKNSNGTDKKPITNFPASAEVQSARVATPRGGSTATPRERGGAVRGGTAKKTTAAEEEAMALPKTPRDRTPVRATRSSSASVTVTAGDRTRIAAPLSPSQLAKQKQEKAEAERAEAATLAKKQRQLLVPTSELAKNTAYKEPAWMTEEKRKRTAEAEAEAQRRELAEENRKRAAENAYGAWRLAQKATTKKKKPKKSKKEAGSDRLSEGESSGDEEHNNTTRTDGSARVGGMGRSSRLSSSPPTRSPSASPSTSSSPRGTKSTPQKKKKNAATIEVKSSKTEEKEIKSEATVVDHRDDEHYMYDSSIFEELTPFTSQVITVAHLQGYLTSLLSSLTNANADDTDEKAVDKVELCVFPLPDLVLRPVPAGRGSSFSGKQDGKKGTNTSTLIGSSPPPPMKIGGKETQSQKTAAAGRGEGPDQQAHQLHPHVAKAHLITVLKFLLLELRKSLLHRGLLTLQHDFPLADLRDFIAQPVRWKEAIVAASADNQTGNHWMNNTPTNKKGRGNFASSSPIRSNSSAASTASSPVSSSSPSRGQHASPSPRKGAADEETYAGTSAQGGAFGGTSFSPNRLVVGGLELGIGRTKGGGGERAAGVRSRSPFGVASVGFRARGHFYVSEVTAVAASDHQKGLDNSERRGEKSNSAAAELFPSSPTRARRGAKPSEETKQQHEVDPRAAPLFKDATTQAQCLRFISQYAAEKVLAVATGPYPATKEDRKGVNVATSSTCEALVSSTVEGFVSQCLELPMHKTSLSHNKSTSSSTPRKTTPSKSNTKASSTKKTAAEETFLTPLTPAEHAVASFLYASDPQGALEYFVDERAAAIRQLFALTSASASQATLVNSLSSSTAPSRTSSNLNGSTTRSVKNQQLSSSTHPLRTTMCPFYHFLFDDDGHDISHINNNGNDNGGILPWGDQFTAAVSSKTRANNNASTISSASATSAASTTTTTTRGGVLSSLSERRLMQLILAKLAKDAFLVRPVLALEEEMIMMGKQQQKTAAEGTFTTTKTKHVKRYFRLDVGTLRQVVSSLAAGKDGGEYGGGGGADDELFDVHAPLRSRVVVVVLAACCDDDNKSTTAQGEVEDDGESTDRKNKPEALVDLAVVSTYDTLLRSLYHHENEDDTNSRGERIVPKSFDRAERLLLLPDDTDEEEAQTGRGGEEAKDLTAFNRFLSLCIVLRWLLIGGPAPSLSLQHSEGSVDDEKYYTNPFFDNAFALSKAAVAAGLGAAIVSPINTSLFSPIPPLAPWVLGGVLSQSVTNNDKATSSQSFGGLSQKEERAASVSPSTTAAASSSSARNASMALLEAVYIPLLASYLLENDGDFSLWVEDENIEGEAW